MILQSPAVGRTGPPATSMRGLLGADFERYTVISLTVTKLLDDVLKRLERFHSQKVSHEGARLKG
ncbi:hypothetical protein RRU01S_26_01380 [Agrobacterium rubi TR3 = NBRC 13261]|uniref:Uncharacterized protein n=1 Tax=Agrobacterium rubi TR3 = NBRC 13261 TaxID=1368415 RepID=A0A081D114_9HYPH|nr:hypothetical protein [Agrobacterium rubi]GAK72610.1 hypothetical protein RRU01S_26_01380 [Agrobacterium rubi TR3 = NBRC 13261]